MVYQKKKNIYIYIYVGSRFSDWAPWTDGIQAQRIHYNEFVESGFKGWVLMRQQLMHRLEMIK